MRQSHYPFYLLILQSTETVIITNPVAMIFPLKTKPSVSCPEIHVIDAGREPCPIETRVTRVNSAVDLCEHATSEDDTAHTVQELDAEISGQTFESCRFPTMASRSGEDISDFSSLPVAQLHRLATKTNPAFESRIHFLQVAWALLLRSYTREDVASFAIIDGRTLDGEFAKATICRFGKQSSGVCDVSSRAVSPHVIEEKQMNTAMHVSRQKNSRRQTDARSVYTVSLRLGSVPGVHVSLTNKPNGIA